MKSLYDKLRDARCETDSHESDLYVRKTPEAVAIIKAEGVTYSYFTAQGTNEAWIDVPFHYSPWWNQRTKREA